MRIVQVSFSLALVMCLSIGTVAGAQTLDCATKLDADKSSGAELLSCLIELQEKIGELENARVGEAATEVALVDDLKGAVVAFNGPCPIERGWEPFTEANGRFMIGAGAPIDPKHGTWQQELPSGGLSLPIKLSTYQVRQSGGEETHLLSKAEIPEHNHGYRDYYWLQDEGTAKRNNANTNKLVASGEGASGTDKGNVAWYRDDRTSDAPEGSSAHNNLPPYYALNFCIKRDN